MNQKGIATIFVALILFASVGFVALVIDLGYMYLAKTQLQNAADAACLAAVATLDGSSSFVQSTARTKAQEFASLNKCAGDPVAMDLNPNNDSKGDIVIGYWDGSTFSEVLPSGKTYNAVKAVARRTTQKGTGISASNKPVSIFFGRIFNTTALSASATAIAVGQPGLFAAPLVLCIDSATKLTGSHRFYVNKNLPAGTAEGAAWTLFSPTASVNANDVKDYLENKKTIDTSNMCSKCIMTNNGVMAIDTLDAVFRDTTYDVKHKTIEGGVVTGWDVGIIIVDTNCAATNNGCPPYKQGGPAEPYHVWGWLTVTITAVHSTGAGNEKGFTATIKNYVQCPSELSSLDDPATKTSKLVF